VFLESNSFFFVWGKVFWGLLVVSFSCSLKVMYYNPFKKIPQYLIATCRSISNSVKVWFLPLRKNASPTYNFYVIILKSNKFLKNYPHKYSSSFGRINYFYYGRPQFFFSHPQRTRISLLVTYRINLAFRQELQKTRMLITKDFSTLYPLP